MTVQDIINWFGTNPNLIYGYFAILIGIAVLGLLFLRATHFKPPITYLYTLLVYGLTIPGLLALILVLYSFFFLKVNFLELNVLAYFVPLIAMVIGLLLIKKTIRMSRIPGFDKLSGLFIMVIITFIITYVLQRMFFGVFFIGRFEHLLLLFVGLLIVLRIAWSKIMK